LLSLCIITTDQLCPSISYYLLGCHSLDAIISLSSSLCSSLVL
jgi:hypothetical protein